MLKLISGVLLGTVTTLIFVYTILPATLYPSMDPTSFEAMAMCDTVMNREDALDGDITNEWVVSSIEMRIGSLLNSLPETKKKDLASSLNGVLDLMRKDGVTKRNLFELDRLITVSIGGSN